MEKEMLTLTTPLPSLEEYILQENNIDDLNDIIDLFNLNLKKKDILRNSRLSDIQDRVVDQMYARIDNRADELSTSDLIQMHKTVQDSLAKSDSTLDDVKIPAIQINQQINMQECEFDRDSRMRILDAVNDILKATSNQQLEDMEVLNNDR